MFRRISAFILVLTMVFSLFPHFSASAAEPGTTITGTISYEYKDNSSVKSISKVGLSNFPITISITNSVGTSMHISTRTNADGIFTFPLVGLENMKASVIVKAENDACYVVNSIYNINNAIAIYTSESKPVTIKASENKINYTVEDSGAYNILKTIQQCRDFLPNDWKPSKLPVVWSRGHDNGNNYKPNLKCISFSFSEYNRSEIAHEYGHYVMHYISNFACSGLGGPHKIGDVFTDGRLPFSEGWATFFGQSVLGNSTYLGSGFSYSIETPDPTICGQPGIGNEVSNTAAMWDITDPKGNMYHEYWDQVQQSFTQVLQSMGSTMLSAGSEYTEFENGSTGIISNATLYNFYNSFMGSYVQRNSLDAYDHWRIFMENGMQFDYFPPTVKITEILTPKDVIIRGTVEDNVKVKSLELWLNGAMRIRREIGSDSAGNAFSFTISEGEYNQGKNYLEIRAYDYAGKLATAPVTGGNSDSKNKISSVSNAPGMSAADMLESITASLFAIPRPEYGSATATFSIGDGNSASGMNEDNLMEIANDAGYGYQGSVFSNLTADAPSLTFSYSPEPGHDFMLINDTSLGLFYITLTDPNGAAYANDTIGVVAATGTRALRGPSSSGMEMEVYSLGAQGFRVTNAIPGTWQYTVSAADAADDPVFSIGLAEKPQAPVITNHDELRALPDGAGNAVNGISPVDGTVYALLADSDNNVVYTDAQAVSADGDFSFDLPYLTDGKYTLCVQIENTDEIAGKITVVPISIDGTAPELFVSERYERVIFGDSVTLRGSATTADKVLVSLNGSDVGVRYDYPIGMICFSADLDLVEGVNIVTVTAISPSGIQTQRTLYVKSDTITPDATKSTPVITNISIEHEDEISVPTAVTVTVRNGNMDDTLLTVYFDNDLMDVTDMGNGVFRFTINPAGYYNCGHSLTVTAENKWGKSDRASRNVTITGGSEPIIRVNHPHDVTLEVGETISFTLSDVFISSETLIYSATNGEIVNNVWSFTAEESGMYPMNLKAECSDEYNGTSFVVHVAGDPLHVLSAAASIGGEVSSVSGKYAAGTTVEIEAIAEQGYHFTHWSSSNGGSFGNENSAATTFTMPNDSVVVTANFEPDDTETFFLTINAAEGGTITRGIDGYYEDGATIELEASPMERYVFSHWSSSNGGSFDNANSADTVFTMPNTSTIVTANFEPVSISKYSVTAAVNITNSWNNGYNIECVITNTGDEPITDWVLGFDLDTSNRITNMWNASIVSSNNGEFIVRNAVYNGNIPVGGSVSFNFTSEHNGVMKLPDNFAICDKVWQEISTAQIAFSLYSSWSGNFDGALTLYNLSAVPLANWSIDFEYEGQITSVNNGRLLGQKENGRWAVTDAGWNATIPASGNTTILIQGKDGSALTDFKVYTASYVRGSN